MGVEGPMKSMLRIKPPKEPSLLRNFFKFLLSEGGLLLVIGLDSIWTWSPMLRVRYESKLAFAVIIEDSISYVSSTIGKAALKENMTKGVFEAKVGES
ncbi:Ecdysone-induced protein E74 [Caligus rogercresseyi]|uniref:Ecdysone-induced protein E74 n=1 Tax=Caligus rogercresseyi TaxID=217165 RepID=A0A7T8K770_CALRO|nr:Ecdysone-induced protein E74 [Caligus rogercresseyi]